MSRIFFRGLPGASPGRSAAPPASAGPSRSAGRPPFPGVLGAIAVAMALGIGAIAGCGSDEPIVTYSVPTSMPAELEMGDRQIAAAIVPRAGDVWFFKVLGSEKAVDEIEEPVRRFIQEIEFANQAPQWGELPEGWSRGPDKQMRFATILIPTAEKQLELSISRLTRQEGWDEQVTMNVNRWRGQVSLPPSDEKWGGAEALDVPAADAQAVWVEIVGTGGEASNQPRRPPMAAARNAGGAPSPVARTSVPSPEAAPPEPSAQAEPSAQTEPSAQAEPKEESELSFDRPEGWRQGRMSMMRMAAFNVGPEDAPAEVTVIRAGGDTRGNVARWLGQLWNNARPPEEVVDQALADAQSLEVDNREAQRFVLKGETPDRGDAIDATIIPLEDGFSLFVKMTGPVSTVTEQSDEMASFLESLKL